MVAGTPQVWMLKMIGAMKAKLEPRKIGTWRRVMSWNSSVPTPAPSSASEGLSPVSSGTSTSAPKATNRIWAPEIACRHSGSARLDGNFTHEGSPPGARGRGAAQPAWLSLSMKR